MEGIRTLQKGRSVRPVAGGLEHVLRAEIRRCLLTSSGLAVLYTRPSKGSQESNEPEAGGGYPLGEMKRRFMPLGSWQA